MRHKIRLVKNTVVHGTASEATHAALESIDGVEEVRVLESADDWVIAEYIWTRGGQVFERTDEVLGRHGLRRDWEWGKDPLN